MEECGQTNWRDCGTQENIRCLHEPNGRSKDLPRNHVPASTTDYTDPFSVYSSRLFSLQEFSNHDNVIQLLNVIKARNDLDIYLVFEFMDTDLHAVVKAKVLKPIHMQYIMYQVSRNLEQEMTITMRLR